MNVQVDAKNVFLSALLALVMMAGALLVAAPPASANREDCPANSICLWSGPTFGGDRAFFSASDVGCHPLANIDPLSGFNTTSNRTATFSGIGPLFANGGRFQNLISPYRGNMCIQ